MSNEDLDIVLGFDVTDPKQLEELVALLKKRLEEGSSLQEAFELADSTLEYLYEKAYSLYNSGLYEKALDIFCHLSILQPLTYRYVFGLAATSHRLGHYSNALNAYMASYALNPEDPTALFYAAHCFASLGNASAAADLWDKVAILTTEFPKYAHLGAEAASLKAAIVDKKS